MTTGGIHRREENYLRCREKPAGETCECRAIDPEWGGMQGFGLAVRSSVRHRTSDRVRDLCRMGLLLVLIVLFGRLVWGQTSDTGAIVGVARDPSGGVVPRAQIIATNVQTNLTRTIQATEHGQFRLPLLPPGPYTLTVHARGFSPSIVRSVQVVVSETTAVTIRLKLGTAKTLVNVIGSSPLAQTESAALGWVTSGETLRALPLANRNFTQILSLSAGVITAVPNAAALGRNSQNVSANGAKTTSNNFQFNGIDANNISENSASGFDPEVGIAVPAPDSIEEFKVQTGMYDAQYGRDAGANVDIVSRSGTNQWHGTAWEFFRNTALDANDFFLNQNHQPRPVLQQNQFGGALGGPIKKNKAFFFFSYQGTIQRDGQAPGSLVSTFLPPLTADRSRAALGKLFGGQTGALGGVAIAPDGSNINPVALALLNAKLPGGSYLIPIPQTILPGGVGESTYSIPARYREDQYTANIDENFSAADQLSARFFTSLGTTNEPFTPFAATVPGFGTNETQRNLMFVLSATHIFSPNVMNTARFGFTRFPGFLSGSSPITAAEVGMATPSGLPEIPGIDIQGLFNIGPAGQPFYWENTNTFVWKDTVSVTRGRQHLFMGGEAKHDQLDVNVPFTTAGFLDFLSFPDFLLGESGAQNGTGESNIFNSTGASGLFRKDERYTDFAGFVQDNVHATNRLVLNLGLRYEFFGPPSEIHGRLSNFDPSIAARQIPQGGSFSGFLLPSNYPGSLPSGVLRTRNLGMWNPDYKDFAPRTGFALQLMRRPIVVLRGGYGIYYERLSGELAEQNVGQIPFSVTQSLQGAQNAAATFQQPFNPPLPPNSAYPIYIPRTPDSALFLASIARGIKSPYTQQYSLNLQFELARKMIWQIGYVGSKTSRLAGCYQFNQALIATPANPVNGQTTTTNENLAQRLPFTGIAGGSYQCTTAFTANYNGLQTSVIRRMSRGLQFQASYTYSKSLDQTSGTGGLSSLDLGFLGNDQTKPNGSYGPDDFDRTHRFVLSFIYSPPRLTGGPRLLRSTVSDWQFSGVSVIQTGAPITVNDSTAGSVYGNLVGFSRAECTGLPPASSGSLTARLNQYFNSTAFSAPPVIGDGTGFGDCGVGILRGPSQENLDLAIQRSFSIGKERSFKLRAEFYNFTNTPKFGLPVSDRSAGPAFGVISSTVANPRLIQFALKFQF